MGRIHLVQIEEKKFSIGVAAAILVGKNLPFLTTEVIIVVKKRKTVELRP
jgi:hypothetical protein